MLSTIASDSSWYPFSRIILPPCWKPFSIAIPIPSTVAPALSTRSVSPKRAHPLARKSSITRMWSSGDKNFFETITSYTLPCVNDWILVLKLLSSRLILFDFFANTTGTSNSLATIAAIPIPLASIVRILLIF